MTLARIYTLLVRQVVEITVDVMADSYADALALYGQMDVLDGRVQASDPTEVKTTVRPQGSRETETQDAFYFRRHH